MTGLGVTSWGFGCMVQGSGCRVPFPSLPPRVEGSGVRG